MNVLKAHLRITITTLLARGASQLEIAQRTGVDRKTIRRYARAAAREANAPAVATGSAASTGEMPPPWPPGNDGIMAAALHALLAEEVAARRYALHLGSEEQPVITVSIAEMARARSYLCGRNPGDDRVGRDTFGNDRSGGDCGTLMDHYSGQNHCPCSNKYKVFDAYGAAAADKLRALKVVIRGEDEDFCGDRDVVTDGDASAIVEATTLIDDTARTHPETAFGVKPSIHENVAFRPDLKSKTTSVVEQTDGVGWDAGHDPVGQVQECIEIEATRVIEHQLESGLRDCVGADLTTFKNGDGFSIQAQEFSYMVFQRIAGCCECKARVTESSGGFWVRGQLVHRLC